MWPCTDIVWMCVPLQLCLCLLSFKHFLMKICTFITYISMIKWLKFHCIWSPFAKITAQYLMAIATTNATSKSFSAFNSRLATSISCLRLNKVLHFFPSTLSSMMPNTLSISQTPKHSWLCFFWSNLFPQFLELLHGGGGWLLEHLAWKQSHQGTNLLLQG